MKFFEVLNGRRSVRQYVPGPVPRPVLEKIVQAGIEAPTGVNQQLKQYLIVDDPARMDDLRTISKALTGAIAAIVLVMDPRPNQYGAFWVQDASAAMENMLLAAVALGYDGCWVEGAVHRSEAYLKGVLGVPDELCVWSLTPIGKAVAPAPRPDKPKLQDVVHYNRF